ncbi:hypothetical protein ACQ4LE_001409 [Meloidogyne hapla]
MRQTAQMLQMMGWLEIWLRFFFLMELWVKKEARLLDAAPCFFFMAHNFFIFWSSRMSHISFESSEYFNFFVQTIRNKNVSVAAHSLIALLRSKKPHLLHHKGRPPPKQKRLDEEKMNLFPLNCLKNYVHYFFVLNF